MNTIITTQSDTETLPVTDRATQYGDGFFTTAKVANGIIEHFALHLARIKQCAERLNFEGLEIDAISNAMHANAKALGAGVLKVLISRGSGGRGYQAPSDPTYRVHVSNFEIPSHYSDLAVNGVVLHTLETRLGLNPLLAGLKTLNRLEQVLIKNEISAKGYEEGLVLNLNNEVIESSVANILLLKDNKLYTPCLKLSGIQGVYLSFLKTQHTIVETHLTLAACYEADALFCCNSLMGLVPVKQLDHHHFNLYRAHAWIKQGQV